MAIYMLDYYLPMLSPNDGYNETGLTMQSAGPVREEWQPIYMSYLYQGSEFGHWKVTGGQDAFAFRHPSLAQTDERQLLDSEAHHHKVCSIGTGRLIALVGVSSAENATTGRLSFVFGLVFKPFPSWSTYPTTPASSSTDHPQSPAGAEIRSNYPSTSQAAMDRLQT